MKLSPISPNICVEGVNSFNAFENNFDLIRLFAAVQVMVLNHYNSYFHFKFDFAWCFEAFSGVPIFLFITGFFIPMSFEHNPKVFQFLRNRCLKIFPEMWASIFLSVILMLLSGYEIRASVSSFMLYVLSYLIYPLYTPEYLRGYGAGTLNGVLWIIPVQLCFYAAIPVLYKVFDFKRRSSIWLLLLFIFSIAFNSLVYEVFHSFGISESGAFAKAYKWSIFVHCPMLILGMFFFKNRERMHRLLSGKFPIVLAVHLCIFFALHCLGLPNYPLGQESGYFKYIVMVSLAFCVFSAGYSMPKLGRKLLGGFDLSYALYVYHMPIANFVIYVFGSSWKYGVLSAFAVVGVSVLSKKYLEDYFVRLKKNSLRR